MGVVSWDFFDVMGVRPLHGRAFVAEESDPATFATVAGVLLVAALTAALVPAWRASRVDPVDVIGAEA